MSAELRLGNLPVKLTERDVAWIDDQATLYRASGLSQKDSLRLALGDRVRLILKEAVREALEG